MKAARIAVQRLGWALVCISFAIWLLALRPWNWYMGDLVVYRGGGQSLIHGRNLYDAVVGRNHLHFTYPPFAAVAIAPLAAVPLAFAKVLMSVATAGAVCLTLRVVAKRIGQESGTLPGGVVPLVLATTIWLEPVRATLSFGQINALLMALIVADTLMLAGGRWGGVLIGIAAAIKLTPLAFVPYLVLTGRRRDALRSVSTFTICAAVGFALDFGTSRTYWGGHRFLAAHRIGRVENASNQSMRGILARALRTPQVPLYWLILAAAVFALLLALAVQMHRHGLESRAVLIVATAMLIASPVSWSHHWVWCAPMSLVLVDIARLHRTRVSLIASAAVVSPFALALVFWAPHARALEFRDNVLQELTSATYVLAGLLFAVMTYLELRRHTLATTHRAAGADE